MTWTGGTGGSVGRLAGGTLDRDTREIPFNLDEYPAEMKFSPPLTANIFESGPMPTP